MKSKIIILGLSFLCFCSLGQTSSKQPIETKSIPIAINWVENLSGDFSFSNDWSYPLGVALKEDGRAGCADGGFCPECMPMLDSNGIVFKDSEEVFYQLLDTTHEFHSIECTAWCYEWAGTNFIDILGFNNDSIIGATRCGIATHCSMQLSIYNDTCKAIIDLNSIVSGGSATYYCKDGFITIDRNSWEKGILKAEFSFNFEHAENSSKPMFWKGKIYSKIKLADSTEKGRKR